MNIWSQIASLGAAVAAFGPPILTKADEQPAQVDLPTIDAGNHPVAVASVRAPVEHPDGNLFEDTVGSLARPVAVTPAAIQPAATPVDRAPGAPPSRPRGETSRRPNGGTASGEERYGGMRGCAVLVGVTAAAGDRLLRSAPRGQNRRGEAMNLLRRRQLRLRNRIADLS